MVYFNGYDVYANSFKRYHDVTVSVLTRDKWESDILNNSESEFWGVFTKESNILIAYASNSVIKNIVEYNVLKAIPDMMNKHYPYYGLLFEMGRHYLKENHFSYVNDGFRSVSEHSNIQPFLEKNFLFRKAYCKLSLHYRWWLKLAINVAYPFRNIIPNAAIKNLLRFEEINRGKR